MNDDETDGYRGHHSPAEPPAPTDPMTASRAAVHRRIAERLRDLLRELRIHRAPPASAPARSRPVDAAVATPRSDLGPEPVSAHPECSRPAAAAKAHQQPPLPREVDVLVVGAGQAGLGTAYWLTRQSGLSVLILDAAPLGQSWLERWDSLSLFTPRRFSALPGMRFPRGSGYPSRTEMAQYLQRYAEQFHLPVQTGVAVERLTRDDDQFLAHTADGQVSARQVVLATGPFRQPHLPPASRCLDPAVWQQHSSGYRTPIDVPEGEVVVVGGGNSAAQLALELAQTHRVTVVSPRQPWYLPQTVLGLSMYWWIYLTRVLNAATTAPASRYIQRRGDAIVGTQLRREVRQGHIRVLPQRVVGARGRELTLADGSSISTQAVLWCTGFRADTGWIDVAGAIGDDGTPIHRRGASPVPGLHWMGLPWQTRLNSSIIDGVDRDAHATTTRILAALSIGQPG